jgi:pimeloyl-ACP methyl ester carboxylesterase
MNRLRDNLSSDGPAYDVAGPADAPTIVFIHGLWLNRKMWVPQFERMADEFRLIAVDLPGHGGLVGCRFNLADATDTVRQVIDSEASDGAVVVGLSLGAYVGMDLASRHPDKVCGLVACGGTVDLNHVIPILYSGAFFAPLIAGRRVHARYTEWVMRQRFGSKAAPMLEEGVKLRATVRSLIDLIRTDYRSRIAGYRGPVLFLNGRRDWAFRGHEKSYLDLAPQARLQLISHAGHMSSMQQPDAFTEIVRQFARSLLITHTSG